MSGTQFTELLQELDAQGNDTGKQHTRSVIHEKGLWHRVVHIWIFNKKNPQQLLIQKRSTQKINHPGLWDIGCAGHVSGLDSSLETAQKELAEEVGVEIALDRFELIDTIRVSSILNQNTYFNNEFVDLYVVELEIDNLEDLKLQEEEVEAVKWISWKEFVEKLEQKDPTFVPADLAPYKHFLEKVQSRYGKE